jgi:hypothetical protein
MEIVEKRMCLLVHGGEHILSIDENSPETDERKGAGQTIAQYEIELRRLAKDCEFHGYDDEMILDRLLSTCEDEKLQGEALSKDWDLKTFMKHATMKQDIKVQTEDIKSEIKTDLPSKHIQATYTEKSHRRSSKKKMYLFKNTENPTPPKKTFHTGSQQKCSRCGYDQSHETCPATGKQCNSCGKLNHFSSCCRKRPKEFSRSKKF